MPIWAIVWLSLVVGFFAGYVLCAIFRRNAEAFEAPQLEVTALSPAARAKMGEALYHAGEMLEAGDFEYLSGGFMVQDLGHGVVNFKGDLSLRAVEVPKPAPKGRDFIGMNKS